MRPRTTTAVGLAAALLLGGCQADDGAPPAVSADPTECVRAAQCPTLPPDRFAELVAAEDVVVVDVRTPEEFATGHLAGAVNLDVTAPDFTEAVAGLDPDGVYALYCRSGNRSRTAAQVMSASGITATADLAGWIQAWSQAGLAVTTD